MPRDLLYWNSAPFAVLLVWTFSGLRAASPTIHEQGAASVPTLQFRTRLWLLSSMYIVQQSVSCFRLLRQEVVFAFSLALASAGNNKLAKIAIIAITTNSSIRVNAFFPAVRPLQGIT